MDCIVIKIELIKGTVVGFIIVITVAGLYFGVKLGTTVGALKLFGSYRLLKL
jgi:hypothetical protein